LKQLAAVKITEVASWKATAFDIITVCEAAHWVDDQNTADFIGCVTS
jgi:hypothetical protein